MKRYQIILLICLFILIVVHFDFKQYEKFGMGDKDDVMGQYVMKFSYYVFLLTFIALAGGNYYVLYQYLRTGPSASTITLDPNAPCGIYTGSVYTTALLVGFVVAVAIIQPMVASSQ